MLDSEADLGGPGDGHGVPKISKNSFLIGI